MIIMKMKQGNPTRDDMKNTTLVHVTPTLLSQVSITAAAAVDYRYSTLPIRSLFALNIRCAHVAQWFFSYLKTLLLLYKWCSLMRVASSSFFLS